ncbi:Uncharacterised protein [Mycobacteroides abscessus subsp. abscessus]|jgi:hypothetical protein|nr:hypothetical protein [Mycobacteroides abscessus]SIH22998.1 Uncharacterised protein [Mycobacteroides abscessus subsp. abscessus]
MNSHFKSSAALFYDGAEAGPTLVGQLLDKYIDEEAGVAIS